ncbi:hypothetical protein N7512_001155 [Penicillium capsulatum]|nr:hypothetical protein N7512_001155 [Penicillium capsulatum]
MSSPHSGPGSMPGLDADNNPDLDNLTGPRNSPIKRSQPLRDVDWRDGPQALNTGTKFRAAHGQRCGMVAPEDQECRQCGRENGTFASCVVNVVDDELQFGGACMNCAWPRKPSLAAEWYSSPLDHLELQGNLESMQQIRRELLTARQRVDQDIAWLTAEIQKQTRNTALVDLLTKVMHS